MSRFSTKKVSALALLTSAVFTISSLAPIEFAPGPLSPDAAFAKSENGKGGGKGGGKSGDKGGKGGEKSAAKSSRGGGKGSRNRGGNGIGGMFSKATKKGGNLINNVFGRDKAKAKAKAKTQKAATQAAHSNGKLKPKDLMAMGLHPSELKGGWMGVLMANPNGNFNSSANSVHGKAREWMEAAGVAGNLSDMAAEAQMTANDLQMAADDLQMAATEAQMAATEAQMAADAALADGNAVLAGDLQIAADDLQMAADEAKMAADDAQMAAGEAQMAADDAQMASEELFEAVTKGKTPYGDGFDAGIIETTLLEKDGWQELQDEAVAEAEAAEAAAGEAPVVEDDTIVLKTGDGETIALAVE